MDSDTTCLVTIDAQHNPLAEGSDYVSRLMSIKTWSNRGPAEVLTGFVPTPSAMLQARQGGLGHCSLYTFSLGLKS